MRYRPRQSRESAPPIQDVAASEQGGAVLVPRHGQPARRSEGAARRVVHLRAPQDRPARTPTSRHQDPAVAEPRGGVAGSGGAERARWLEDPAGGVVELGSGMRAAVEAADDEHATVPKQRRRGCAAGDGHAAGRSESPGLRVVELGARQPVPRRAAGQEHAPVSKQRRGVAQARLADRSRRQEPVPARVVELRAQHVVVLAPESACDQHATGSQERRGVAGARRGHRRAGGDAAGPARGRGDTREQRRAERE